MQTWYHIVLVAIVLTAVVAFYPTKPPLKFSRDLLQASSSPSMLSISRKSLSLTVSRWSRASSLAGVSLHPGLLSSHALRMTSSSSSSSSLSSSSSSPATPLQYDHARIDPKWQAYWDEHATFATPTRREGKGKKYVLDMFPYPSGSGLHVGHPEGYTATDIMARYWRMQDYDVLHPMGWDAFGLPAEQHAINTGTHPSVTTYENIANFKRQLKSLGFSYDWDRELATTDDAYVRWTQWIFLKLVSVGLASQSEVSVNWCEALGTVLANEEIIDGLSERGAHPVVRRPLRQWVLKITDYADQLEEDLQGLAWPSGTLSAQKQWIGRSVGASVRFQVDGDGHAGTAIEVFTTRCDTLMGATYLTLAPEHPLVSALTTDECYDAISAYVSGVAGKSDLERTSTGADKGKTGVATGAYAVHPLSGERVPIWIADYVLANYGTGAVMAVPAHDDRDFEFATRFQLPVKQVVSAPKANSGGVAGAHTGTDTTGLPYTDPGITINSGSGLNGLGTDDAKAAVVALLAEKSAGEGSVTYKLRDWVFSRQRYWGEPIPIYFPVDMHDPSDPSGDPRAGSAHTIRHDEPIPVADEDLPLRLPPMDNFQPGNDPQGCLARALDWRYFQKDGQWYARETNTMPQWAGSCWYYLRFADPTNSNVLCGEEGKKWLPVDLYVGGQEHAVLHLLYARFWHKVLYDIGVVDHKEPFTQLVHQGMILGMDGEKMSKSRGNVINPDDVVNEHGADVLRLYEMFMGPLEATKPWQTAQVSGMVRFRDRCYAVATAGVDDAAPLAGTSLEVAMHKCIKKVTSDIERFSFNTAISEMMVFSTAIRTSQQAAAATGGGGAPREAVEALFKLMSPFAPHIAEEGWCMLGHEGSISKVPWPESDASLCVDTTVTMAVQVNGKVRGKMEIEKDADQEDAYALAIDTRGVGKWLEGKAVNKVVYVAGRIINIIAK